MPIETRMLRERAQAIIRTLYGPDAQFREGQYEAIEAVILRRRVLLVRKTGWGKSLVYFVCTKLLREAGMGVTMVVSPLLVLMQNQLEAAQRLGLRCDVLNSTVKERRAEILRSLAANELDLLLITPETLFREDVQATLHAVSIGLFVIDEAHCISDWGHDFRLDYGNLKNVIRTLPANVPLLATTATANNRVVADLEAQLGESVFVSRGPLTRESLYIQAFRMESKAERYAWLLEHLPSLRGSGIIYCLTHDDCRYLADFLNRNGIPAEAYYSSRGRTDEEDSATMRRFERNEIKAIVATVKLGMGYDKADVGFVIHFQMPYNIVTYYQQIGRAGRDLRRAYAVLMYGREDEEILESFTRKAFPTEAEFTETMKILLESGGIAKNALLARLNIPTARLEKTLAFLVNDGYAYCQGWRFYPAPKRYVYDREHYEAVTRIRRAETEQLKRLCDCGECYSKYVANCLDDETAEACGHCAFCAPEERLPVTVSMPFKIKAASYIDGTIRTIEPRKRFPASALSSVSDLPHVNRQGICLARYGEAGYGELVKRDKYGGGRFCDDLLDRSVAVLSPFVRENAITHLTYVPSLRSTLVEDFARRLAAKLGLAFLSVLTKTAADQQKNMENSAHQFENAYRSFGIRENVPIPRNVLLVDDMVDSRWTLTVCGLRLMEHGCVNVFPFALADSHREDN